MNPVIADYINALKAKPDQAWQADVCTRLDELVRQAIPDVQERIQYSKPHYLKNGQYACVISAAKAAVSFTIFNAQALEAPDGFFEPGDPNRRTIKISKNDSPDYELLARFVREAAATI
jgi:hypothetical protein